jgi:hypothetical protein
MTCWLKYVSDARRHLKKYNVNDSQAEEILKQIEGEVGHNSELIKAVVDFEKEGLIKRLKKKKIKQKAKKETSIAYM